MPPKPQRHVPERLFPDFVLICLGLGFIALLHQALPFGFRNSDISRTLAGGARRCLLYSVEGVVAGFSVRNEIKSSVTTCVARVSSNSHDAVGRFLVGKFDARARRTSATIAGNVRQFSHRFNPDEVFGTNPKMLRSGRR